MALFNEQQLCAGDRGSGASRVFDTHHRVVGAVSDQRRRLDVVEGERGKTPFVGLVGDPP